MAFVLHAHNAVRYYKTDMLAGTAHGFATRMGGVSAAPRDTLNLGSSAHDRRSDILENYARFTSAIGVDAGSLVFTKQIHKGEVQIAVSGDRGNGYAYPSVWECDALVTNTPGLTLTVFWADCVPVLLYDPEAQAIGAVHAGWRGTALGITANAVSMMAAYFGTRPVNIRAAIGPSIGPCCFETGTDVPDALSAAFGAEAMCPFISRDDGRFHVDLGGVNAWQLEQAGVRNIDAAGLCTCCLDSLFFSHRRMGAERGTHAAMIAIKGVQE